MSLKYKYIIATLLIIGAYIFLNPGRISLPVEKLEIPSGIGIDLETDESGNDYYKLSTSVYTFNKKDEIGSMLIKGKGMTIPQAESSRQLEANRKFVFGVQRVILFNEQFARYGMESGINQLFKNQYLNDMTLSAICGNDAADILGMKIGDYPSSADYIEGLMDNAKEYHFFSDNYKLMDVYVRVDSEGRNLVLPYVEMAGNKVKISGMALFKKDKMVRKTNVEEAKVMSILRENNVKGILTIYENFEENIGMYATVKRKVKCVKNNEKYNFTINLDFKGDIENNNLYENLVKDPETVKKYEYELSKKIEEKCNVFIEKMKKEYKVDCLDLGRVAAAKYGRDTGVDWNEIVCKSDIEVNVKVKVDRMGRGKY